jgi:hypothetical protein
LRYPSANKTLKTKILDEFTANAGYSRKYAIKLLNGPPSSPVPQRQRKKRERVYAVCLLKALELIWDTLDCICSKRLQKAIPDMIDKLQSHGYLHLSSQDQQLLKRMSSSTIDRMLSPVRRARRPHGRSTTRGITYLKRTIPIHTHADRHYADPGHLEMDLVAHCGQSTHGDYVVTLDSVDIATFWVEPITPENRGQHAMLAALRTIRQRLPFPLLSLDSDNDLSFINGQMQKYCQTESIVFGRSRPYRKNDQAHIEQRNWSIVRQLIGYDRYEKDAVAAFNRLWEKRRLFANYLLPVRKLLRKERVDGKVHKEYDDAQTPFQRVIASPQVTPERKAELAKTYQGIDPIALKAECDRLLRNLWEKHMVRSLPDASSPSK